MSENLILAQIELFTTSAKVNMAAHNICIRKGAVIRHEIQKVQNEINQAISSDAQMTGEQWSKEAELMKQYKLLQFEADDLLAEAEHDIRRAKALRDTLNS